MKKIQLTQGKYALVDEEDYQWLSQWKWYYGAKGAAIRTKHLSGGRKDAVRKMYYMHREIMKAKIGEEVDHINRNPLDNRKSNLRLLHTNSKFI